MSRYENPFANEAARREIWDMLVERDIEAFVQRDWKAIEEDFAEPAFYGLDARGHDRPDEWRLSFPDLSTYRSAWLEQAERMAQLAEPADIRTGLQAATILREIEVIGDTAVAHKKFDGEIRLRSGATERLAWQTLYFCKHGGGGWKITGFVGYLPLHMGAEPVRRGKERPAGATQHATAGPYSPVLSVEARRLVVISGQAALAPDGSVQGDEILEQTRATLQNCRLQLASARCDFSDVFKVNVYLTDLGDWEAFNDVYARVMPEPRPVRTAVQAVLLPGLLVEVEMWAALP